MAQPQKDSPLINKDHHDGNGFRNPWPSFIDQSFINTVKAIGGMRLSKVVKQAREEDLPEKVDMDWELLRNNTTDKDGKVVVTWLGQ